MWLDLVKQGIYINLDDNELAIRPSADDDWYDLCFMDHEIPLTRDERDMFVALHKEAMERDECVFSYNQDSPKFRMTLSAGDELETDVELE